MPTNDRAERGGVRFRADERGTIAIVFALLLVPLLLFAGGAIDYARYNSVRADLIESMDAAGLGMAQMDALDPPELESMSDSERTAALKEYGREFFHENFRHESVVENLVVDFEVTAATITPRATGQIKTILLKAARPLLGGSTGDLAFMDLTTDTEITRRGSGKIELALVLDVTGSMGDPVAGVDKIDSLREATDTLLSTFFGESRSSEHVKIGVVPFNAYVNPAGADDAWDSSWTDANALAPYHGARFFHVDQNGNVDMSTKVNHLRLHDSVTAGSGWMGCVEARPYPLDELDTVPGQAISTSDISAELAVPTIAQEPDARVRLAFTRAPALRLPAATVAAANSSRFVPLFVSDEPDCKSSASYCMGDWTDTESYVNTSGATVNVTWYGNRIDDPEDDGRDLGDYDNRNFISDERYTDRNESGEYEARYWVVANQTRTAISTAYGSLSANMQALKTMLANMNGTETADDEYVGRQAYVGWWNPATSKYRFKYDISPSIDETITDDDEDMRGPNQDCPAAILPMTNNRDDIEQKLDALHPNGNTNSANGMLWGWSVLSPTAPFSEGVEYDNGDWQKAVVLMTDGQNTMSNRDTHWGSSPSVYGYEIEQRMGAGVNNADDDNSAYSSASMRDQLDEKLLRICRRMKQEGILVYTIVFGLNDANLEQVFKSCATSPTAPYYYKAPTGAQLEAAFGNIAQDLVNLHVSR